jgi:SAM-dependent methyltransferase
MTIRLEGHFAAPNEPLPPRENNRYAFIRQFITPGVKVLDIGCSNGWASRFFEDCEYTGIDHDAECIKFAKENYKGNFFQADINEWIKGMSQYDIIIAYEIIEHLENGLEIVKQLQSFCRKLIISVPLNEPPGFWGPHHKLYGLKENDFRGFQKCYMSMDGNIHQTKQPFQEYLLLGQWDKSTVAIEISSRGRGNSTLPLTLQSILNQTVLPQIIDLYFDEERPNLSIVQYFFHLLKQKGVQINVLQTSNGQVPNHQFSLSNARTSFICRIDDDEVLQSNAIERYKAVLEADKTIGAVCGPVITPQENKQQIPTFVSIKMEDIKIYPNLQWYYPAGNMPQQELEHIYSSFMYRVSAAKDYPYTFSRVGHREESVFSHQIYKNGYKLIYLPDVITMHYRAYGGIRSESDTNLWKQDDAKFEEWAKINNIKFNELLVVLRTNAVGDSLVLKNLLPEIKEKHKEKKILLASNNAEIFEGCGLSIISEQEGIMLIQNQGRNPNDFMPYFVGAANEKDKLTLEQIYRKIYAI